MEDKNTVIQNVKLSRKNLVELVIIAILLSLGVNLIADQLLNWLDKKSLVILLAGISLCLVSIAYSLLSLFSTRTKSHTYEAFIIQESGVNNIAYVPGYDFSEEIHRYIQGGFTENPALLTLWKKHHKDAQQLITEAVEYYLLEKLSIHLDDYFHNQPFKKTNLAEYSRQDIPSVLLSNKFLELFSRPMSERSAFAGFEDDTNDREVVYAYSNGAIYKKFGLTLPKGSKVTRPEKNKLEIETKKLKILLAIRYDGYATVLPEKFEEYYLNLKLQETPTSKGILLSYGLDEIYIDIKITIKLGAILSSNGWEYYKWVDSFLNKIENAVSREAFFHRINWDSNLALLRCLSNTSKTTKATRPKTIRSQQIPSENNNSKNEDDNARTNPTG
ncbi:MAG TPA: hypothetical protein VFB60_26085 [Ktedonobacteraceae bacterium]|nr:hypothetical protein [Ktedonobacteraceae bacterium]